MHVILHRIPFLLFFSLFLMACKRDAPASGPVSGERPGTGVDRGGEIALTFDDAPRYDGTRFTGLERTARILGALSQEGVNGAMFFCNTNKFDRDAGRERVERYARAGHSIGNHTHAHLDLDKTSPEDFIEDIRKADETLRAMPGFVPVFRYPHSHEGSAPEPRRAVREALDRMGYKLGYFTADAADWYVEELYQSALKEHRKVDEEALRGAYITATLRAIGFNDDLARAALGRSPKHVLILHETDVNALFLLDLIRALKSSGWKIIPAEEAYADPLSQQIPRGQTTQHRLSGIAAENGYNGPRDNPWSDPAKLDALLASAFR